MNLRNAPSSEVLEEHIYIACRERERETDTDRGRTGETEKGRRKERRSARGKDGHKEAADLQKHYWARQNVAERRACT